MGLTQSDIDKWLRDNPDLQVEGEKLPRKADEPRNMEEILRHVAAKVEKKELDAARAMMRDDPPQIKFKSKTEERAWNEWVPTIGCTKALYEPVSFYLPSGRYKPDFLLLMPTREMWFVEVKGSWNAYQSGRSSKKSLLEAANAFWFMGRWYSLLPQKGGGWSFTEIQPHVYKEFT